MKKEEGLTVEKYVPKFTKEQLLQSKAYNNRRDAISAVLADGKEYSLEEVDALIEKFMKGKVNK